LLDNITPKGDRQCLKRIGLRGFQAPFVIKMPRLHFGGSKRLSVLDRYSLGLKVPGRSSTLRPNCMTELEAKVEGRARRVSNDV